MWHESLKLRKVELSIKNSPLLPRTPFSILVALIYTILAYWGARKTSELLMIIIGPGRIEQIFRNSPWFIEVC
jgi:hypothetical protein